MCNHNESESTSGFVTPSDIAKSDGFTDFAAISGRGVFQLTRAKRNGRWWMLKGLREEYRHDSIYRAFLEKEFEIASQLRDRMLPGMKRDFTDTPDSIIDAVVFRGFTDALLNNTTLFKQDAAESLFKTLQQTNKEAKIEKLWGPNRDAGKKFLAENAKKEGVVTLPSGLQYKVLVKGEGKIPQVSEKVFVNYEGRLVDGTVFDASSKHGSKPSEFRPNQVIKGWTEALTMMPVGSKWQLYIPYELGYGEQEAGTIKPFSTLIFDVELVGIDKPKPEEPVVEEKPSKKAKKSKK